MTKKATIQKVDDTSWLVIDQHRGNVGVLYQMYKVHMNTCPMKLKKTLAMIEKLKSSFGAKVFKNTLKIV